jgi:uncharacterized iron-regulated protein
MAALSLAGCALGPRKATLAGVQQGFEPGAVVEAATGSRMSREELVERLLGNRVIYLGERHDSPESHRVQLDLIRALFERDPGLVVGMEMFDHTYQPVLDRWSAGELETEAFLERVHWYANWRYDFDLYREILETVRSGAIPLKALNLPFHIPPKIAAGGIDSLMPEDRRHLPDEVDTSRTEHREALEAVFRMHRFPGRSRFDYFYQAQCAWEDTMAAAVAQRPEATRMVVLAGNGHIRGKGGIPDRAYDRRPEPFVTLLTVTAGERMEKKDGDLFWVIP